MVNVYLSPSLRIRTEISEYLMKLTVSKFNIICIDKEHEINVHEKYSKDNLCRTNEAGFLEASQAMHASL
jgi:hypothetical protein